MAFAVLSAIQAQGAAIQQRTGAISEPFSQAVTIQELPDGRVVVGDVKEPGLFLVNFNEGSSRQLGRVGNGPNEYTRVGLLSRLAGDTVAMVDFRARRLLLITGEGRLAGTRPLPFEEFLGQPVEGESAPEGADRIMGGIRYLDQAGRSYYEITYFEAGTRRISPDGWVARWDPESRKSEVVTPFRRWYPENSTRWRAPFMYQDVWTVSAEGRVARVISAPYHVEWLSPDTPPVRGNTVRYDPIKVVQADHDKYWEQRASQGAAGAAFSGAPSGGRREPVARRSTGRAGPTDADFPEQKPPFVEGYVGDAAHVSPQGEVWVTRVGAAGDSVLSVDIFDARGHRTGSIQLPPHRRILGVGRNSVYLLRIDEDDLQWLERYRR